MKPTVLIPVALGTNRDGDLAEAFALAGADPVQVPLSALRSGDVSLADHQMLAVPGGFSYGDALGAGRLLGLDLAGWFGDQLHAAVASEMPIFGVCNGFQALVRAGVLPGGDDAAVLAGNDSGRFECRWVTMEGSSARSVWTSGLTEPIRCPIAHGEGRYASDQVDALADADQIALRYVAVDDDGSVNTADGEFPANPNGSAADIAGVCDPSGFVLGLMPHPENHVLGRQDPLRGRPVPGMADRGLCLSLFEAGVAAIS